MLLRIEPSESLGLGAFRGKSTPRQFSRPINASAKIMCGIAGLVGVPRDLATEAAPRMLAAMRHRGPDDSGMELIHNPQDPGHPVILLHTRLAILDPTA